MTFKLLAKQYLEAFSRVPLNAQNNLGDLLTEDCYLRDWEIEKNGRQNILDFVQELYDGITRIDVDILNLHQDGNTVAVEFIINLQKTCENAASYLDRPGAIRFVVTDIIEFTDEGKIKAIRAFKGPFTTCHENEHFK